MILTTGELLYILWPMKTNRIRATAMLFIAAFIWGGSFVVQKLAGQYMGAFTYNGVRFAMGSISLFPVIMLMEKPDTSKTRRTWLVGLAGGAVLFAAANLQQFGIVLSNSPSSASEAGFITGLYTVFVPLFGLLSGRKTTIMTWLSAILAFTGLALISIERSGIGSIHISYIFLVIGAVFWALHILLIDHFVSSINPIRFAAIQFAVCSALSLISAFSYETVSVSGLLDGIVPLLLGGVLSSGIAYTLQILGQRGVEPTRSAIIFSLESLFAAISEAVLLGTVMTARKYIGGAVIFIGILLSQTSPGQKRKGACSHKGRENE